MHRGRTKLWLGYLKLGWYLGLSHGPGAGSRSVRTLCPENLWVAGCLSDWFLHGCSSRCCCFRGIPSCCCCCYNCCSLGIRHCCCSSCYCTAGCCDFVGLDSMIVVGSWSVGCSSVVVVVWSLGVPWVAVHSLTEIQLPSADGNLWRSGQSFRSSSNLQTSVRSHFPGKIRSYSLIIVITISLKSLIDGFEPEISANCCLVAGS